MSDKEISKAETKILIIVLIVLFGLALVVARFADEIDGIKQPVTQRVVAK